MPAATVFFDLGDTLITTGAAVDTRFTDTLDTLQVLQARGYRIGLLSDQPAGTTIAQVRARLAALGIARYVESALTTISTEIPGNVGKPGRPIFDLALAKATLTAAPADAVFVTEQASHVSAARSFGWRAVVLKRGGVCAPAGGECVTALTGLLAALPAPAGIAGTNLDLAPPPALVDGLWAVPIDISRVEASLVFDAATRSARGDASVKFRLGRHAGCPILDLRQTPDAVELDGAPVAVTDIAAHDFGGGPGAEMRVLARTLAPGSSHTLRVHYPVGVPQASTVGSYQPQVAWAAGPRLTFNFGFTDLGPGRYAESFLPANLVFDQVEIVLDLQVTGTAVAHQPITNGDVRVLGANHWSVTFPARFTALSPMLELRAADRVTSATHTEILPVSGTAVTVTAWKPSTSTADVAALAATIGADLAANEASSGRYLHGDRFTAFIHVGGMEYDGATTSGPASLRHEAFHSWWGRGLKPASQVDAWIDESWTVYAGNGASAVLPLDFGEASVTLSPRNPWGRVTPSASYTAGERLWKGLAAVVGAPTLRARMNDFYTARHARPVTTEALEAHLLAGTGRSEVVDAFHRFVYGLPDPSPLPDLWLRDEADDTGAVPSPGRFWDSPDLWVRTGDDGGLTHQNPESGQDNWINARVRNRSTTGTARHLVVSFTTKFFAGSQFVYPADWLPATTAAVAFDVGPGETRILKARWPREQVPPPGTHPCLLAAVFTRFDAPQAGKHVWEQNNLAQKNLTVVDLKPDTWFVLPFVVTHLKPRIAQVTTIDLVRPARFASLKARLIAPKAALTVAQRQDGTDHEDTDPLPTTFPGGVELPFPSGERVSLPLRLRPLQPTRLGLRFQVPADAPADTQFVLDIVQRTGKRVVGGVAVEVTVVR